MFAASLLLAAAVWQGHTGPVTSIALAPNGVLYSCGTDGTVRAWSRGKSQVIATRSYQLYSVAVSPDGKTVAICGDAPQVDLVEIKRGKTTATVPLPSGWCEAVAFSPDGRTLAVGRSNSHLVLADAASGKEQRVLDQDGPVTALAWSPDGRLLASGAFDVAIWNAADGTRLQKLTGGAIRSVAFDHDGTRLAAAGLDKVARIWKVSSGELARTIEAKGMTVFVGDKTATEPVSVPLLAVVFSSDGSTLATAGSDRTIRLWDLATGKEVRHFEGHQMSITGMVVTGDERQLVTSSLDGTIRTWDLVP